MEAVRGQVGDETGVIPKIGGEEDIFAVGLEDTLDFRVCRFSVFNVLHHAARKAKIHGTALNNTHFTDVGIVELEFGILDLEFDNVDAEQLFGSPFVVDKCGCAPTTTDFEQSVIFSKILTDMLIEDSIGVGVG